MISLQTVLHRLHLHILIKEGDDNMDLKGNFKQAAKELFNSNDKDEAAKPSVENAETQEKEVKEEKKEPIATKSTNESAKSNETDSRPQINIMSYGEKSNDNKQLQTSIFTEEVKIEGRLQSSGHIEMRGKMKGDIEANGDVKVYGQVSGNVNGGNITLCAGTIQGNVVSGNEVIIDEKSVVVGDIKAKNMVTNGKVKGNITLDAAAVFEKDALLVGDVQSAKLSVQEGAEIQGKVIVATDSKREKDFPTPTEV